MSTQEQQSTETQDRDGVAANGGLLVLEDGTELREGYAEVGDVTLHYVEAGTGPLIVLLHGSRATTARHIWRWTGRGQGTRRGCPSYRLPCRRPQRCRLLLLPSSPACGRRRSGPG